jgi:glycine cleavage system transcriptional repressor
VAAVARVVADHGGNITDLNTRVIGSPARPVYAMVLEIHLPGGPQHDPFQAALERLKPTLGVDITLRPIESVQL